VSHFRDTLKTATVRQIRNKFPEVLRMLRDGGSVAITSRRKVVATLTPPPPVARAERGWGDLADRRRALLARPVARISGADLLTADRE